MIKIITEGQEELVFKIDIKTMDQQIKLTQHYYSQFCEIYNKKGFSEHDILMANVAITWDLEGGEISVNSTLLEFPKYRDNKGTFRICPGMFSELQDAFYEQINVVKDDPKIDDAIAIVRLSNSNGSASVRVDIDLAGKDEEE